MAECPFIPPYPVPLAVKPGLIRRFWLGWSSWIHTLCTRAYTMKMGETRLPRLSIFMVNEAALVRRVLDDADGDFPKHPLLDDLLGPLVGHGVFVANGQDWTDQRAMIDPAFAHTHLARTFPLMAGAAADLVARIAAMDLSRPVDVDPLMTHVAADIMYRTLFSRALDVAEAEQVHRGFATYQKYAQRSTTLGLYGLPRLGMRRRARAAAAQIRQMFTPIIAARMAEPAGRQAADILDTLIAARHPRTGAGFTLGELVDQVAVIFLAGHETSASTLAWTLYLLAASPDMQGRLIAQAAVVRAGQALAFPHLRRLDTARNVLRETLRLYPAVSFLPRMAGVAMRLRDKVVRRGDMVVVAPWLVHRNPDNWSCPHAFDPDRFTRPDGAAAAHHAWLPFGRGPRVCVGAGFAQQEMLVIVTHMLDAFQMALPPEGAPPELVSRLTLRPRHGIRVMLSARG